MAHSWGSHAGSSVNPRLKLVREDQEALRPLVEENIRGEK